MFYSSGIRWAKIIFDFSPIQTELIHSRVNIANIARFLFEFWFYLCFVFRDVGEVRKKNEKDCRKGESPVWRSEEEKKPVSKKDQTRRWTKWKNSNLALKVKRDEEILAGEKFASLCKKKEAKCRLNLRISIKHNRAERERKWQRTSDEDGLFGALGKAPRKGFAHFFSSFFSSLIRK